MSISEHKPPPIRTDLEVVPHYYRGELSYICKDMVTLKYFRLGEVEYIVLKCFQRGMGVEQTQQEVKKNTGAELSEVEIFKFANQLRSSNLLKSKGMEDARRLVKVKTLERKHKLKSVVSNYLFITIPVWDPDRALDRLLPYFRFFLHPFFAICWLAVGGGAAWVVVANFGVLVADAFSVLSGWNLLILSAVIFCTKFFHEMGHALTCKHFGGEVHAIGPAFLVFQPCMYTDTTDAWLFPSKWQRIAVTGAGIMAEWMLASAAALVWVSSDPGLVKQVAYTVMIACTVSNVLFNANPLLRFDGYYILADLVEIPNLRIKTVQYLSGLFDRYVLGIRNPAHALNDGNELTYLTYGIARFLYRCFIIVAIGLFLMSIFAPLGFAMLATSAYGMLVMPVWKRGKQLARQYKAGEVRIRYLLVIVLAFGAVAGLWFMPMDYRVDAPCVVAPVEESVVRAPISGRIVRVFVEVNQQVNKGQKIVEMDRPDVRYRAEQVAELIKRTDALLRLALDSDAADYAMLARQNEKLVEELTQLKDKIARFVIRAPHDGIVVNVRRREAGGRDSRYLLFEFPAAEAAASLSHFKDTTVSAGTGLLRVARTDAFYFQLFVYEHDYSYLNLGDPIECKLAYAPSGTFTSQVRSIAPVDVKDIENVGITLADIGYIPVKPTASGEKQPLIPVYEVRSRIAQNSRGLMSGTTGKARITYGRGPVGTFYLNRIVRALRLRLQKV